MRYNVTVTFDGGNKIETFINGTREEVLRYYAIGTSFNVGRGAMDYIERVASVEIHEVTP